MSIQRNLFPLALRFSIAGAFAVGLTACGSRVDDYCSKLDECNLLQGESKDECVENIDNALENLSSGARSDCEKKIDDCNEIEACSNFQNQCARIAC